MPTAFKSLQQKNAFKNECLKSDKGQGVDPGIALLFSGPCRCAVQAIRPFAAVKADDRVSMLYFAFCRRFSGTRP